MTIIFISDLKVRAIFVIYKFYLLNKGKMTVKWTLLMASGKFAPFFEVFIISLTRIAIFYHIRALSNSKKVWKKELKVLSYQNAYVSFQVSILSFFEILKDFRGKSIVFIWVACDCDPKLLFVPIWYLDILVQLEIGKSLCVLVEKEMANHSSSLAWRIPMDRRAWQITVHGIARLGHDLATKPPPPPPPLCIRETVIVG